MTQKHQRQLLQQRQLTDQDSSDESQNHSSQHSNSSKTTSSSTPETENSHDESQNFFQQTDENESSSESPPPQQQQNSQDAFFISKQQILQNFNKYGEILKSPDPNYTHVRLYRLPTMLTTTEYEHARKYSFSNQMGQKPCQNYNVIDLTEKSMFRRPLPSCKRKPLNNLMIHQALKNHCQIYHDDCNKYIFKLLLTLKETINSSAKQTKKNR